MGLENGIILIAPKNLNIHIPFIPVFNIATTEDNPFYRAWEVCNWCKCWDLRGDIIQLLGRPADGEETKVSIENMKKIVDLINTKGKKKKNIDHYLAKDDIPTINKAIDIMGKHPECKAIFYDSY
jgi:hypothetical protein